MSCLNTSLVVLMLARRKAKLPFYLNALREKEYAEKYPGCLLNNFHNLLRFWQRHYLNKDKDSTCLENVRSCHPLNHQYLHFKAFTSCITQAGSWRLSSPKRCFLTLKCRGKVESFLFEIPFISLHVSHFVWKTLRTATLVSLITMPDRIEQDRYPS